MTTKTTKKPLITVIGSLNIDFVTSTTRVPGPGETLTARSLQVNAGGKGANQAVACGKASFVSKDRQDIDVDMVGAVSRGDPYYGSLVKPSLEKSGVNCHAIREVDESQTGTATILVEDSGENRILVVPGANHDAMRDARLLQQLATRQHTTQPAVLVMQGEIPRQTVLDLLELFGGSGSGGAKGPQIVFNPAPVYPEGIPLNYLRNVDFLIVNETECVMLGREVSNKSKTTSTPSLSQNQGQGQGHETSQEEEPSLSEAELAILSADFHNVANIKHVIVTLGSRGVFFHSGGDSGGKPEILPGLKVEKVVDTTGAGDTFVGYFATSLARHVAAHQGSSDGFDLKAALTRANAAAALCVQRSGAIPSIPYSYEVQGTGE